MYLQHSQLTMDYDQHTKKSLSKTLYDEIRNGNLEAVKDLVNKGVDINADEGCALELAVMQKNIEMIEYLVKHGGDLNTEYCEALSMAAEDGDLDMIKFLHASGATSIHVNNSALLSAIHEGHLEIVKYLYENGAEMHPNDGAYIDCAASNGRLEIMEFLLSTHVYKYNRRKCNFILCDTSMNGYIDIFKCLINYFSNKKLDLYDPYCEAVKYGHLDIVRYIRNIQPTMCANKNNVVTYAVGSGHLDVVRYICDAGIDQIENLDDLLHKAVLRGHVRIAKYLQEIGANLKLPNAFNAALDSNKIKMVKYVVDQDTNLDSILSCINADGNRMLKKAIRNKNIDIVKFLIDHGVDIHFNDNLFLEIAIKTGCIVIVKCLCENSADLPDKPGWPILLHQHDDHDWPFLLAAKHGHTDIVKYFHEHGAYINVNNGSALRQSAKKGMIDTVRYLLQNGAQITLSPREIRKLRPEISNEINNFSKISKIKRCERSSVA